MCHVAGFTMFSWLCTCILYCKLNMSCWNMMAFKIFCTSKLLVLTILTVEISFFVQHVVLSLGRSGTCKAHGTQYWWTTCSRTSFYGRSFRFLYFTVPSVATDVFFKTCFLPKESAQHIPTLLVAFQVELASWDLLHKSLPLLLLRRSWWNSRFLPPQRMQWYRLFHHHHCLHNHLNLLVWDVWVMKRLVRKGLLIVALVVLVWNDHGKMMSLQLSLPHPLFWLHGLSTIVFEESFKNVLMVLVFLMIVGMKHGVMQRVLVVKSYMPCLRKLVTTRTGFMLKNSPLKTVLFTFFNSIFWCNIPRKDRFGDIKSRKL